MSGVYSKYFKRIFDCFCVLVTAPLWVLAIVVISILIRIKIGSPVFFNQERAGLNGDVFKLIKFRSMTDARDAMGNLLPDNERLTPFGKFLRESSLDELPSLIQVLQGKLSLVGPRPLLVDYLELYNDFQNRRHEVLPGVTGWAQINGRNAISWDDKFKLDVEYVEKQSFWFDMKILFLTVIKVLKKDDINASEEVPMERFTGNFISKK